MSPLVDAGTLREMLDTPELVVVDCRFELLDPTAGLARYAEGRIPGARYANLDTELAGTRRPGDGRHPLPARETFAETLRTLGVSRTSCVVAYDDAGGAVASRLWWMLSWLGHGNAAVLDGGIGAWVASGGPLETAAPADQARGDFEPSEALTGPVVETAELERLLASGAVLLDARAAERFTGETEPIDPVAGHVPGARNLPFTRLLTGEGRFAPPEMLSERFAAVLDGEAPGDVVTMCGSGVTACHLLLGMAHAGLEGGRLYAGSWSAWITDPKRPVATDAA